MMALQRMANFTYKKEKCEPISASDYAIRYDGHGNSFAKDKGSKEFRTDFKVNNEAYEVLLSGVEIDKEEYDNF